MHAPKTLKTTYLILTNLLIFVRELSRPKSLSNNRHF